jgi:hypothetical protein
MEAGDRRRHDLVHSAAIKVDVKLPTLIFRFDSNS